MPVLGICNGFQILCESHLLPGALIRNNHRKFGCLDQTVRIENNTTAWTTAYAAGQEVTIVLKNGEGSFVADQHTLDLLEGEGRVVARYVGDNPNGSQRAIAGVTNEAGNVVGLMPHPEHAVEDLVRSRHRRARLLHQRDRRAAARLSRVSGARRRAGSRSHGPTILVTRDADRALVGAHRGRRGGVVAAGDPQPSRVPAAFSARCTRTTSAPVEPARSWLPPLPATSSADPVGLADVGPRRAGARALLEGVQRRGGLRVPAYR